MISKDSYHVILYKNSWGYTEAKVNIYLNERITNPGITKANIVYSNKRIEKKDIVYVKFYYQELVEFITVN